MIEGLPCSPPAAELPVERLNRDCFCITLDRDALSEALRRESGDAEFFNNLIATRPHLFSAAPVFLPREAIDQMLTTIRTIEAVAMLPAYREKVLSWAPEIARRSYGPRGAFMGYDFHLCEDGPKLIEVNTNAGGAFLNAFLAKAQLSCCSEMKMGLENSGVANFEAATLNMFKAEFSLQRKTGTLSRVAIVDERPEEQYLYPEFLLAQRFFQKNGIDALIVDASDLRYECNWLQADGRPIDLVYNRLTDFSFESPDHASLRAAYLDQAAVITPNPSVHAVFADKRNLALLTDAAAVLSWDLPPDVAVGLKNIPHTVVVDSANADQLWAERGKLFFKPAGGHGSKAVYRGDKVTRRVWGEITRGGYVAQDFAPPSERLIEVDGVRVSRKVDVRLYVYGGEILLAAARLYQGQTTNFRTLGGGFAPVLAV
jgi:hypothetical protein